MNKSGNRKEDKPRPMYQLLTILHNRLENEPGYLDVGLCATSMKLYLHDYISTTELDGLKDFIRFNPPTYKWNSDSLFYWEPHSLKPRMVWLKQHILLTTQSHIK